MKFNILLWLFAKLLSRARKKNSAMRTSISTKVKENAQAIFQFETDDHKVSRYLSFSQTGIQTKSGKHPTPSCTINLQNSAYAYSTFMEVATGKNKNAFLQGIQEKRIKVQGDLSQLLWLQGLTKYLK